MSREIIRMTITTTKRFSSWQIELQSLMSMSDVVTAIEKCTNIVQECINKNKALPETIKWNTSIIPNNKNTYNVGVSADYLAEVE